MSLGKKNWIEATGQMWKLYLALGGFAAAFVCFVAAFLVWDDGLKSVVRILSLGTCLAIASFAWLVFSLRCQRCDKTLVWKMITTRPHTSWLIDLANLTSCPHCLHSLNGQPSALGAQRH